MLPIKFHTNVSQTAAVHEIRNSGGKLLLSIPAVEDSLTIDDSGFLSPPDTTAPTQKLHIESGGDLHWGTTRPAQLLHVESVGIGDMVTPPELLHIVTPAPRPRFSTCDYCGHRYHNDTERLYCTQCGAPLPSG